MKISIASAIALLTIGVMSCTSSPEVINPTVNAGSKQGAGGGGSANPAPIPTSLPTLTPNPTPVNNLGPIMPTGTWTVKSYYRSFSESTSNYSGYKLAFAQGGLVTVTDNKGNAYTGSWFATIGGQVPYYGSAPSITALTMIFSKSMPQAVYRLSATWNVNMATTTTDVVLDNFEPLSGERVEFAL